MKYIYTFLYLFLLSSVASGDASIVGAFGQRLGAAINPIDHSPRFYESVEDLRGVTVYEFVPSKPYREFMSYLVFATPVTKLIFNITVSASVDKNRCSIERGIIKTALEENYPEAERTSLGDITSYSIGDRFIDTRCEYISNSGEIVDYLFATDAILSLIYVDITLHDAVLDERASQVDKSNF